MKIKVKVAGEPPAETIRISSDFIRLDALLKFANLAQSGGEAKIYILEGLVKLNGEVCLQRGKKVYPGDMVRFQKNVLKVIGSGDE